MVQARFQDRMKAVEHPEKLTRTELRAKQAENLRLAREGYADRLRDTVRQAFQPDIQNGNRTVRLESLTYMVRS